MAWKKIIFFCYTLLILDSSYAKDMRRRKRDGDLLGGLGNLLGQLATSFTGNSNSPNPDKQGPLDPATGQAAYCEKNPADCSYVSCLAQNFQNSEQSQTIKMGGKVLTDRELRKALQTDPTISQAACDKVGLKGSSCDGFKSFLGLIDKIDPGDTTDPRRDPNRGKRSPDAVGVKAKLGVRTDQTSSSAPTTTTRSTTRSNTNNGNGNGNGNGRGGSKPSGADYTDYGGSSGRGSGSSGTVRKSGGTVDYTDYGNGGGGGSKTGSGNGNGQPGSAPVDCSSIIKTAKGSSGSSTGTANSGRPNGSTTSNSGKNPNPNKNNNGNKNPNSNRGRG